MSKLSLKALSAIISLLLVGAFVSLFKGMFVLSAFLFMATWFFQLPLFEQLDKVKPAVQKLFNKLGWADE